ncbi:hypothetical protein FB451DRAFT_1164517 [Mycena latifolia]|nr:hypothetical protein FB451DRAFT_1164517 [Mycena latifolia]
MSSEESPKRRKTKRVPVLSEPRASQPGTPRVRIHSTPRFQAIRIHSTDSISTARPDPPLFRIRKRATLTSEGTPPRILRNGKRPACLGECLHRSEGWGTYRITGEIKACVSVCLYVGETSILRAQRRVLRVKLNTPTSSTGNSWESSLWGGWRPSEPSNPFAGPSIKIHTLRSPSGLAPNPDARPRVPTCPRSEAHAEALATRTPAPVPPSPPHHKRPPST